jgi:hypothetical protein
MPKISAQRVIQSSVELAATSKVLVGAQGFEPWTR